MDIFKNCGIFRILCTSLYLKYLGVPCSQVIVTDDWPNHAFTGVIEVNVSFTTDQALQEVMNQRGNTIGLGLKAYEPCSSMSAGEYAFGGGAQEISLEGDKIEFCAVYCACSLPKVTCKPKLLLH